MKPTDFRSQQLSQALSTRTLLDFLEGIRSAMAEDDELVAEGKSPRYGVRYFEDFKRQGNAIENVLTDRGVAHDPIDWTPRA